MKLQKVLLAALLAVVIGPWSSTFAAKFDVLELPAVPSALACYAVGYAVTRKWAQGFLPDAVTLVPFQTAAVLSAAFCCVLAAVWACWRKQHAGVEANAG